MKRILAPLFLAIALTACGSNPQQKVFNAHLTYDAALSGAVFYKELPKCPATPLCSEPAVVATLQKSDNVAFEALSAAQKVVRAPASTQTAMEVAATWATEAIAAFSKVVSIVKGEK